MIVQISLFGNLFVLKKKTVSPAFAENCFYHLLLVSFIVRKKFSWKNLIRKNCFLEEEQNFFYLLLIFAPSLFWAKTLFYFPIVLLFFAFVVFFSFFFFCLFFSGVCFPNEKSCYKISRNKKVLFPTFSFELFGGGNIFWSKKECVQKLSFEFFFKKKSPFKKKRKKLISRFTRVEDRVRDWRPSWPLLRVVT